MSDYSHYIEEYLDYLKKVKQSSANTVDSYMRDIRGYIDFCEKSEILPQEADNRFIEKYLNSLIKHGKTPSTAARTLASIRSFYQFLIYDKKADVNPTKNIKIDKPEKKLPEILTQKEVDLLLSQPDITTLRGCRDKAMLELMYATGIRVTELIDIDVEDVNLTLGILHCRNSKSQRVVPIYKEAVRAIEDYLARVRPVIMTDRRQTALFMNLNGERLTRQGFWKIIKSYAALAGIEKDITPHTIRHSFAAHLLENGAAIQDLQEMLGNSVAASTNIYTQIINQKYEKSYNRFHPKTNALRK